MTEVESTPIVITNLTKQKANIVLDASKIDLFETCPARYNFRHNLKKSLPIIQKAKSLDLGSLAHEGLEVYYNLLKDEVEFSHRISALIDKIHERSSDPENSNSESSDVTMLCSAIEASCDYWRAEDENCLKILAVEQAFAYLLHEDEFVRIIISGKIDLLVNFNGIGRQSSYQNLPIDHKTFQRDSALLRKSNQFINYASAVNSNYLVVNRIGLYSDNSKKNSEERFKRLPLSYDPLYIQQWKDNLTRMILNEYLTCVSEESWPEKPTSCNKFNRLCEYYEICDSSGQEAKDFKLNSIYVDTPEWDVTSKLGE